jgi:hypothetical protein
LPETIGSQFEKAVISVSYKCLVNLQEASKGIQKLHMIEDEKEESGHFVSTFDRSMAVFKTLSLGSILTHFKSLHDYLQLCSSRGYNLTPLMDILKAFSPIFEVFFEYCQVKTHSEIYYLKNQFKLYLISNSGFTKPHR